ncbi:proton channel OtopLc-like isoform X1 [Trichoplusia ni]|uniref:Proton channel OtopLc-like isoform X1 n=1 Tax=Trichoplusia ni TaxID=7111 RepID=A0A7E5X0B3_TRINI|nr:proton channel OtopLc-like isoform X1 [Trichoplusia ni]XP_026746594.1 proton channel OtopLc-like isoform X1 [Trichoplusia ni]XP_026746598.1 proton channel OtopLc-like isoform X1 [Trichoplusia ni]
MQRCPYIHEMKERLLGAPIDAETKEPQRAPLERPLDIQDNQVGTIVKLNSDGYGSHTSPARAPLVTDECEAPPDETEALTPTEAVLRYRACCQPDTTPKNAKTSLFIISSFIYAKLLVVVCIAYVISDVITHNLPLYYYEGFFTYLYGMSILFLLYVFCFLLQESTCCSGSPPKPKPPPKEKKPKKEKEKKTKDKEAKEGKDGKDGKDKKDGKKEGKSKDKGKEKDEKEKAKESKKQSQFQEVYPRKMRDKVRQQQLQLQMAQLYASDQQQQDIVEMEAGPVARPIRRRKTSQNDHSHGSFFLRIGAIAFGLGTMIYNGLEFGTFFELPLESPCYLILKGVNPVLQMVFTFMQMYFIFMNSRLNIHRFKVIARFGLMHVVATNICVWIRTLVLESLKEITDYHVKNPQGYAGEGVLGKVIRKHTLRHSGKVFGAASTAATTIASTVITTAKTTGEQLINVVTSSTATPSTTPTTMTNSSEIFESFDGLNPAALIANIDNTTVCGRNPIMGTIVSDSAPYLYPFIIEYSLIGAAVIYVMWKHIGRYPSVANDEDLERRLEAVLSRRAAALAAAQRGNRVDCAGASKGLFCGLLLLVASLICLILFFVLIRHQELKRLSIYLADVSHCALMVLSILAILIGFIRCRVMKWSNTPPSCTEPLRRVQSLKFRSEEQSDLNDILLRVSAFGLFVYAVFSVIAGGMGAFTHEPNLLVMITGCLSVLQVVLQLLFIADVSRRRVHLPEQERSKPARQAVTFLLICNVTMWLIYTFEAQKVLANPVQLDFYGFVAWSLVQRFTLPLCIFHRFHSAVTLAEIWKTSYKARLE